MEKSGLIFTHKINVKQQTQTLIKYSYVTVIDFKSMETYNYIKFLIHFPMSFCV